MHYVANHINVSPSVVLESCLPHSYNNSANSVILEICTQLKGCVEKSPKWVLISCQILLFSTRKWKAICCENLAVFQISLRVFFHAPLQLMEDVSPSHDITLFETYHLKLSSTSLCLMMRFSLSRINACGLSGQLIASALTIA